MPEGWLLDIALAELKLSRGDAFGLLLKLCRDCVGAVGIELVEEVQENVQEDVQGGAQQGVQGEVREEVLVDVSPAKEDSDA